MRRRPRPPRVRIVEVVLIIVVSLALAVGIIAFLSGGLLAGRDDPGITGVNGPLGAQFRDLGDAHLAPGAPRPTYDSVPPTSGPHVPEPVLRDGLQINDDQLLQAISLGNVVLLYGGAHPPTGLRALASAVNAPFSPALAEAGQAVILARRPGTNGVLGVAWTRLIHVPTATDPALRSFVLFTLGQGAGGR